MLCHHAVCLSVTFMDSVEMNKLILKNFSPSGIHIILVFPYQMSWQYSDRDLFTGASHVGREGGGIVIFDEYLAIGSMTGGM